MDVVSTDPREYLSIELERLDLLLHREVLRLRASYELSLDEFRGLYISDAQVDQLIDRGRGYEGNSSIVEELQEQANALDDISASRAADVSPWRDIVSRFALSRVEADILLLAAAPEIDLKYETLFAYLNNDVTRKNPTLDLAQRLFGMDAGLRLDVRRAFASHSRLMSNTLIETVAQTNESSTWLSRGFRIAPVVARYIGGTASLDSGLTSFVSLGFPAARIEDLPVSQTQRVRLGQLAKLLRNDGQPSPVVILSGPEGSARGLAVETICRELNAPVIGVDLEGLWATGQHAFSYAQSIVLYQKLFCAGLQLGRCEALFDKELQIQPNARRLISHLCSAGRPVFLSCLPATPWRALFPLARSVVLPFDEPDYDTRLALWEAAIGQVGVPDLELGPLADRFALTPRHIRAVVQSAIDQRSLAGHEGDSPLELSAGTLFDAARAQSDQSLGNLATKVKSHHGWQDLVLPATTLQRVRDLCGAIKYRQVVYGDWGFGQRIANGTGIRAVFGGASGTGKTMTAGVIANELGVDLYRIDLAGVVSKYIGETEKNLDAIFKAAHSSNGILFFDEADALFGKRSEVKDAHDRYANIEVSYLLQKIEEFEGVVILASNLTRNIDDAFTRRMQYVIDFPLPDETLREKLWRGMFPPAAPVGNDLDFSFLARQFQVTGGDIRNVVLEAAFLAAQNGRRITMKQMVHALARQLIKQGRVPTPSDFKQFASLVNE